MTLLLLHGFTGSPASWDPVLARLEVPVPVLRPALTGHGAGEFATSFDEEVERLARIVRWWATGPTHVCGYSMGGRLALALVCRHPSLFSRATILGAHPGFTDASEREEREAWQARWVDLLVTEGLERFVEQWERLPLWAGQEELGVEVREGQRMIRASHDPNGLAHAMRCLDTATMGDLRAELPNVCVPTRLVVGERDAKFQRFAEEIAAFSAAFRVVIVEGAGHNVVLERPAEVAALLETDANPDTGRALP